MLEFGMSMLVTESAKKAWSAVKAVLITLANADEKHGSPPRAI